MWDKMIRNRPFLLGVLTVMVWFFLEYIIPLVCPVLLAMLFVTIFGPLMKKMQKRLHVHRQVGAALLLLVALVCVTVLAWVLSTWLIGSVPDWVEGLGAMEMQVRIIVHKGCEGVGRLVGADTVYLENTIINGISENVRALGAHAVPDVLWQSLEYVKLIGIVGSFLATFVIATLLLAKDYDTIMNGMIERESCHVLLEVICGVIRYIATFVRAQFVIMAVIGSVSALLLSLFQIPSGALWGVLAGVLDALPFIGTSIVFIPLAVVQFVGGNYGKVVVCLILYGICILIREMLEPRLIGNRMGVPAIAVLVSLYVGIQLFGVWGIIKGPLGFVLIRESYLSIQKNVLDRDNADFKENMH